MRAAVTTLLLAAGARAATCEWGNSEDSCVWAQDGECDESGSAWSLCRPGTDTTDCSGRRLDEQDESSFAVSTHRRLSESNGTDDGFCALVNAYSACGLMFKKTPTCWKDDSEYTFDRPSEEGSGIPLPDWALGSSSTTEICCAASADDCCESNAGVVAGFAIGIAVFFCAIIGGAVMCCIFLPCCKCCPCNQSRKKEIRNAKGLEPPVP